MVDELVTEDIPKFSDVFAEMTAPGGLSPKTVRRVFDAMFAGAWTSATMSAFLVSLRLTGNETPQVIAAAASAMRAVMIPVAHDHLVLLDTCGTGGDGAGTLNLSTGAALIAAAAGVPVAKHGNRAATSRAGSADVLEAMGIALDVPGARQHEVLSEVQIAFLFAQAHHPSMRNVNPVRKELGVRTLFNCLGPLANPAGATHQLLGAFDDTIRPILAGALLELGTKRSWVVRSEDGLDEMSPFAPTRISEIEAGRVREFSLAPEDFGLSRSPAGAIAGAEPAHNARVLEAILRGENHPARDAILLNAAASLVIALGLEPKAATERARAVLASGAAHETLTRLRSATAARRPAPNA
ncbi:MAG TPA: anthranilate phosphoribosyltransferase [Polyangiaceae bacterium]|nr:anthranilate phosphoribosyltransferase [Polyangiaceae bacterium]